MMPRETDDMLNLPIEKRAEEIKDKARDKVRELGTKIEERVKRVADLRTEYEIDDAALVELLTQARRQDRTMRYSYTSNSRVGGENRMEEKTIGAGVVNNLLTESDFIESEKAQVKKLKHIINNLRPLQRHTETGLPFEHDAFAIGFDELEYLGF